MVAPDNDLDARPEHRTLVVFSEPAQAGGAVFEDRRLSLALRSAAALAFGIAFLWPALPEALFIRLFAAYAVIDGLLALAPGGWSSPYRLGWPLMIGGGINVAAAGAVYLWLWFGMTLGLFANIAMLWAIGSGVAFTLACLTLREFDTDRLFLAGGIASLVFGRALLSQLATDPIVLSTWMGLYALTMATLFLKIALKHSRVMLL